MVAGRDYGWRLEKAERFMAAAERAFAMDDWETAVSRAYYASYHAIIALLDARAGIRRQRWDHAEVQFEFRERFGRRGFLFNIREASDFESLYEVRLDADYAALRLNRRGVERALASARSLVQKINEEIRDA